MKAHAGIHLACKTRVYVVHFVWLENILKFHKLSEDNVEIVASFDLFNDSFNMISLSALL